MRNLILLRGTPGVGKSTWLKKNNLTQYAISPDTLRIMFQSPISDIYGIEGISQKNDKEVWRFVFELLEQRMKRGEFTIIDATHSRTKLINCYRELCKKYRYRCTIVDFKENLKTILKRNKLRDNYKFVPEDAIMRIYERLKSETIPGWVNVIESDNFNEIKNICFDFTKKYKKVIVFGDIHGCINPLLKYFKENPYSKKNYYVFTGDYFDRGIQNIETFNYIYDLMKNKNILCLTGNHETCIGQYLNNEEIKSKQSLKTFEEFENAGIDKKYIKDFYNRLGQMAYFKFYNRVFTVTHGGIPNVPSIFTATNDYIRGIGKYSDSNTVDLTFSKLTKELNYSIHGHRNIFEEKIQNTEKTFNLEGKIEFGGYLRILEITPKRFKTIEIKNNKFNKELSNKKIFSKKKSVPLTNNEAINNLTKDKDIKKKQLANNVYSFNFTNKVFKRRLWNESTIKARGLFIDVEKEKVVARSYDKFFNWNEMNFTKSPALKDNLVFPVIAWEKENGFLGILSVHNGEWFIASKSTNEQDYAEYFKKLVIPYLTEDLKKDIIKNDISLVFEVIDIENDPHIIEYEQSDIILLDIFYNSLNTKKFTCNQRDCFCSKYNFYTKRIGHIFNTWEELYKFKKEQDNLSRLEDNIEGWVFEDSKGFNVKYKTRFYSFWKSMRFIQSLIIKKGGNDSEIRRRLHSLDDFTIYNKMIKIPIKKLESMNIIEVRNKIIREINDENKYSGLA